MQKPRIKKTAMQLWVADNRKRLTETPADIARLTGVTVDTARAWESRGSPNEDAIRVLERHFGVPAPTEAGGMGDTQPAGLDRLLEQLAAQTAAITRLAQAIEARTAQSPLVTPEQEAAMRRAAAEGEPAEPGTPSSPRSPDPLASGEEPHTASAGTAPTAPLPSGSRRP